MNYQQQALDLANKLGVKLYVKYKEYGKHWETDTQSRCIFRCRLQRGRLSYSFDFGQSIASGDKEPTMYDVLACLQKYEVGDLNEFCSNFGYDPYESGTKRMYRAVVKEYEGMCRLFSDEELEELQEIA